MRRFLYEPLSKKVRAANLRRDGAENRRRGFQVLADCCFEEAEWLDPTPPTEFEARSKRRLNDRRRRAAA